MWRKKGMREFTLPAVDLQASRAGRFFGGAARGAWV